MALAIGAPSAFAQDAGASQSNVLAIEEIVVTALKRSESLQDTAATVVAFTEGDIENIGVKSMRDFAKLVPNLFLVETQASNFTFVNIRGISQFRNTDPSVAVVIDGVLGTSAIGLSQELFDVQQIEVLKGPQGALYGRNSLGGAINITTKAPSNEFEGYVRGGFGNGNAGKAQASLSGPLVENELYGRLAVSYYNDDGFRNNIALNRNADASRNFSGRGRLLWEPTDQLKADLRFNYSKDLATGGAFVDTSPIFHETAPGSGVSFGQIFSPIGLQPAFQINMATGLPVRDANGDLVRSGLTIPNTAIPLPPFFAPNSLNSNAGPLVGGDGVNICVPGNCALQVPGAGVNVGDFNRADIEPQTNLLGIDRRVIYNTSLLVEYEMDFATLTATSSWDKQTQFAVIDNPPRTQLAAGKNTQFRQSEAFSQEIRLVSPDDQRLRWIVGVYGVQTDTLIGVNTQIDSDGVDSLVSLVTTDPSDPGRCANPGNLNDPANAFNCVLGFEGAGGDNLAYAVFGEVDFDITDTLKITLDGRYDRDERKQTTLTPNNFLSADQIATGNVFGSKNKANFDSFQPKATIRWTPLDNFTTYATYAEGFRSGLFNRPGIKALADALRPTQAAPPIAAGIEDIAPQQDTKGVEGGFKYNSEDGRWIVNAAGFYTRVNNLQTFSAVTLNTPTVSILSQVIIPIDHVNIWGAEFDTSYLLMEGLLAQVSLGWTDSEVTRDTSGRRGLNNALLVGNQAPSTPDYTLNVNLQYDRPMTIGKINGNMFLRSEYQRIGKVWDVAENFSQRDPLDLVNLRGGFETEDGLRIEGWAKNVGNKDYLVEAFNPAGFSYHGKLRQWGFEVTKRF